MENFKKASRLKLRFNQNGIITIEDLWDLPLTSKSGRSLDNIAKSLNKEIKESEEESFVSTPSKANEVLQLKFEIVKEVIDVKLEELKAARKATEIKREKEKLMTLIEKKQNESLEGESLKTLKKRLEKLG